MQTGVLHIVSTPIGNLGDITIRALDVLRSSDIIAAEDTRHSRKLLTHFGISARLVSCWSEREKTVAGEIISCLKEGRTVSLISDAGTPGISDPGGTVVRKAIEEGITVVTVPGPCAAIAALSISGLPAATFTFIGFLPPKQSRRRKELSFLANELRTLVFYEAPHRIIETLSDMAEILGGNRNTFLARELTKIHEETFRGTLSGILGTMADSPVAGEYVIIVEGGKKIPVSYDRALEEVLSLIEKGMGRKEAVVLIAEQCGLSRKTLYDRSLGKDTSI